MGCHARTALLVSTDGSIQGAAIGFHCAVNKRDVGFVNFAVGKHFRETTMGGIILGNHDQAACLLIQAMHDSRTQRATCFGEVRHVVEQGIHQGASVASAVCRARTCMHHHARRLVDDCKVSIFIHDVQRDIFSFCAEGRDCQIAEDGYDFAGAQFSAGFY